MRTPSYETKLGVFCISFLKTLNCNTNHPLYETTQQLPVLRSVVPDRIERPKCQTRRRRSSPTGHPGRGNQRIQTQQWVKGAISTRQFSKQLGGEHHLFGWF